MPVLRVLPVTSQPGLGRDSSIQGLETNTYINACSSNTLRQKDVKLEIYISHTITIPKQVEFTTPLP